MRVNFTQAGAGMFKAIRGAALSPARPASQWLHSLAILINSVFDSSFVIDKTPSYLISAPNIIHIGVKESVAIQLDGAENPVKVKVYLFDVTGSRKLSKDVDFELTAGNGYRQIKDIAASANLMKEVNIMKRKDKYISLAAECPQLFTGRRMVPILLSTKKGYIFIQTDKPIYTPGENVRYRIFTLDQYMRPVSETIKITTYNSRNVQFPSKIMRSGEVFSRHIKIPDIAEPGIWRIEAQFEDSPMSKESARFEVKEFVLPSFKVEIECQEKYYLITKDEFKCKLSADYTFGKPVEGMAYVRFGTVDETDKTEYLRGLEQTEQVKHGEAEISLTTANLLERIKPLQMKDLVGHNMYLAVTVFETSSGEMEEVEIKNIKFVSSPYAIDLSKTSGYFIPKVPFTVLAQVTYPDGSPASGVPVKLEGKQPQNTEENGQVMLIMQSPADADTFEIKVTAGNDAEIMEAKKTVRIYQSNSKSYLHVNVPHDVLDPGSSFSADLAAVTSIGSENVKYYYYMIISKGTILKMDRIQKTEITKLSFPLSTTMVPAFRLVIYYYINVGGKTERVANSAWIDVKDVCEGKITLKGMTKEYYNPGGKANLFVETEDNGNVYLAIVDTAIYILNNKNKLTAKKVSGLMHGALGGPNVLFCKIHQFTITSPYSTIGYDLSLKEASGGHWRHDILSVSRHMRHFIINQQCNLFTGYSCKTGDSRMKRSLDIQAQYVGKVSHYTNSSLRKCCTDGMTEIPMKTACGERAKRIEEEECRKAFLTCCDFAVELRKNQSQKVDLVGRTAGDYEDDFFDESSVRIRSNFPQTWQWRTYSGLRKGENKLVLNLPDSITTWEIQAVGMFRNKGFCVAEPKKMKVFRPFFIHLRLPYSVKRNEQLEVRAILYNYLAEDIEIKIYMKPVDSLCSPATGEKNARTVIVQANSAYPIYFSVVPLAIGTIPISVVAYSNAGMISDAITKNLKVVGEGVMKTEERSIAINPNGRSAYEIFEEIPSNMVPDTNSYLYIRARGEMMGESVENCLTPEGIDLLIRQPKGCAEQTSMYMSPTVFAVRYLDKSEQWLNLKAERKDEAIQHIEAGYNRILEFKKSDGSYGAWLNRPSSTWLTAFVVKILSIVRTQIQVNEEHIQQSALYLVKGQRPTGYFVDPKPVIHREMQGGIGGAESKIALTAFVTIALQHSLPSFLPESEKEQQVKNSIQMAFNYLSNELDNIQRPYVLAITAYALALVNLESSEALIANDKLRKIAIYDKENGTRHWKADEKMLYIGEQQLGKVPRASAITVEATSYALLLALLMEDLHYANTIAKWLTEQRNYNGGFRSTQDTVLALEALAEYSIASYQEDEVDITFTFSSPSRSGSEKVAVKGKNALVQEQLKFPLGECINVQLSGRGNGTLTVRDSDYPDYGDYGALAADQPMDKIRWFDLRSRRKRDAPANDAATTLYYEVCAWHDPDGDNEQKASGMAIVDISLLSGFEPENADLDKLKNLADRYIDSYEFKDGRMLLYLNTVTKYRECFVFGAKQIIPIGLIQPASATLYDYYNPSIKCSIFYNAPEQSTIVSKLCQHDVCECAEGSCPRLKRTFTSDVDNDKRIDFACYTPIVDYAYIVQVINVNTQGSFIIYSVSITRPVKRSKDENIMENDIRHVLKRKSCSIELQVRQSYLLMGKDGKTTDLSRNIQYILDSDSWIEAIPSGERCRGSNFRKSCEDLYKFIETLEIEGCQI
ncbi:complement C4-B-like [Chiloscyllium plagiosum]|uniref:complement C4-B-like n=1 Tax=Chiloscyllium plagiosum TaxID=36176 RepID=UPI001CB80C0F|nr:complement C4-B-like [Chiloscyllium plagiosum]